MKIGMGVRGPDRLNKGYIQHIAQLGAPHAVMFMPDKDVFPRFTEEPWSVDELSGLRKFYAENGVTLHGFENFHPSIFYKVLLDLPGKEKQLEYTKRCIANMGKAGLNVMGYNFSVVGVTGMYNGPFARGGANTDGFSLEKAPVNEPMPKTTVGARLINPDAEGYWDPASLEEMIERRDWFVSQILPVAEEAGIKMAAHPTDPPVPVLRTMARILINPQAYDDLFAKFPSPSNCMEFCQGTFAEMGVDVYEAIRHFAKQDKIGYVHFRNVIGTVPEYKEVFIDEGDTDMVKALMAYKESGYNGVLIPDHTPNFDVEGSRAIGMAYAIGYMRALMKVLDIELD